MTKKRRKRRGHRIVHRGGYTTGKRVALEKLPKGPGPGARQASQGFQTK